MSSFALESINFLDNKQFTLFGINVIGNVALSLGAVILGRMLPQVLIKV
jgi:fluoride ion exporter CrcB/FEX